MRQIVVCLAIIVIGGALGANVYNSVVDARSWGRDIPASLLTAQQYFAAVNPGTFFRVVSPVGQVLSLAVLILCWKVPGARVPAAVALAAAVGGDLFTFAYFFPRNDVMLGDLRDVAAATDAWREWSTMNHARSAIVLIALVAQLVVLTRVAAWNAVS